MLILRYKLIYDTPSVPAGEILVKRTGEHAYFGETHPEFSMSDTVVEDDPTKYRFVSATDDTQQAFTDQKADAVRELIGKLEAGLALLDQVKVAALAK